MAIDSDVLVDLVVDVDVDFDGDGNVNMVGRALTHDTSNWRCGWCERQRMSGHVEVAVAVKVHDPDPAYV